MNIQVWMDPAVESRRGENRVDNHNNSEIGYSNQSIHRFKASFNLSRPDKELNLVANPLMGMENQRHLCGLATPRGKER